MKKLLFPLFLVSLIFFYGSSSAQILKRIKSEVKNKVENRVVNKAGNAAEKVMDKSEEAIRGDGSATNEQDVTASSNSTNVSNAPEKKAGTSSGYKSYDFVAGDKIIFEPDLSKEADAELPARFEILAGNAEIQSYKGEKILHLGKGGYVTVAPLMNSQEYLPEQFTLEFDMMYENEDNSFKFTNDFDVSFMKPDGGHRSSPVYKVRIHSNTAGEFGGTGQINFSKEVADNLQTNNVWHHIAIYVRDNVGKAYINESRVLATNALPKGAAKVFIQTDGRYGFKIKNVRLAAGGDDKYKKIVTDGKFITYGILFDVNKADIKPQSMGALNEIAKLMKDHPDLNFEIQGHTDSDGSADLNLKLSEERAAAVKTKLLELGIQDSRLSTKGFGSQKPIDKNDSAEGKANNRRVEFIKV